jgi:hypothetical protein
VVCASLTGCKCGAQQQTLAMAVLKPYTASRPLQQAGDRGAAPGYGSLLMMTTVLQMYKDMGVLPHRTIPAACLVRDTIARLAPVSVFAARPSMTQPACYSCASHARLCSS